MPTTNLFDLSGRVAVVTGGNGGIGRGIALGLAQAGAAVAVLARNEEKNQRVTSELQALGVAALAVRVDVSVRGELQPALEKVEEKLGPVSVLVNNAGIAVIAGVLDQNPEDWDKVIETNLNACFLLSKLAAQSMVKQRQGKIINIASMYSLFGSGFAPSYSAAKGALVQLQERLACFPKLLHFVGGTEPDQSWLQATRGPDTCAEGSHYDLFPLSIGLT